MPFPFAHPAAVLPLRRYCNRWLNFPALVIGSLVPDAGYLFDDQGLGSLSHEFLGSLAFGLPIGILLLAALYHFRTPVVGMLPARRRQVFLNLCLRPIGPLWLVLISCVIGIWTHVIWDSFTHTDGWIVAHLSILQTPIIYFDGHTARVCHLLWYGSSLAGFSFVFFAFEKWKLRHTTTVAGMKSMNIKDAIKDAILLTIAVVPVSLMHHLIRGPLEFALTAAFCVFFAIVFVAKLGRTRGRTTAL